MHQPGSQSCRDPEWRAWYFPAYVRKSLCERKFSDIITNYGQNVLNKSVSKLFFRKSKIKFILKRKFCDLNLIASYCNVVGLQFFFWQDLNSQSEVSNYQRVKIGLIRNWISRKTQIKFLYRNSDIYISDIYTIHVPKEGIRQGTDWLHTFIEYDRGCSFKIPIIPLESATLAHDKFQHLCVHLHSKVILFQGRFNVKKELHYRSTNIIVQISYLT